MFLFIHQVAFVVFYSRLDGRALNFGGGRIRREYAGRGIYGRFQYKVVAQAFAISTVKVIPVIQNIPYMLL